MNPRQYKKLCKKAMKILIDGGMNQELFSQEEEYFRKNGRLDKCHLIWGLNTGPDYYGECDWYDAWFVLRDFVATDTADWDSCTGSEDDNPYRTSISLTIDILKHGRSMSFA